MLRDNKKKHYTHYLLTLPRAWTRQESKRPPPEDQNESRIMPPILNKSKSSLQSKQRTHSFALLFVTCKPSRC
jgi:hypothetical protein